MNKTSNIFKNLALLIAISMIVISCQTQKNTGSSQQAKYVFFFIGDGMGAAHVNATEAYQAAVNGKKNVEKLSFTKFPVQSFASTFAANRYITGSAAAGTALATGHKTSINTIGMDEAKEKPLKTIAEMAHDDGFKVGFISSVQLNHATPAAFYAHQPERNMYFEIANQLPESNFEFFGGGGLKNAVGTIDGKEVNVFDKMREAGYTITRSREEMNKLKKGDSKVFVTSPVLEEGSHANRYVLDHDASDISQAEVLDKAIELLDNPKGFFIMLEGGKIDWAAHGNDGAGVVAETKAFDDAVKRALAFYEKHPDETLILVTADHETGGMSVGNRKMHYEMDPALLQYQKSSPVHFTEMLMAKAKQNKGIIPEAEAMEMVKNYFGLGAEVEITKEDKLELKNAWELTFKQHAEGEDALYDDLDLFTVAAMNILNQKAGIGWTSGSHTAVPVPVYAIGVGQDMFKGYPDNTELPKAMMELMGLKKAKTQK